MSTRQKFTPSVDGIPRTTVRATCRLTAEEWQQVEEIAADAGTSPDKMLCAQLAYAIRNEIENWRETKEEATQ